ncbi:DJ-1 [Auriculariales sp. MPI-PUGE-AT-0066]|nr:DJ-1 [Auriculariales sp. MPI-PUGE-AT-0066]
MELTALVLIADGTEEMEFTIAYDLLVRAGIACTSAFVGNASKTNIATCSRGVKIVADTAFAEVSSTIYDVMIIPGGAKGAETLSQDKQVQELVRQHLDEGRIVGMVCAGTLTARTAKLVSQPVTSHPSVKDQLADVFDYKDESVVVSDKLVTSRGPGSCFAWTLKIIELLLGDAKAQEIRGPLMIPN